CGLPCVEHGDAAAAGRDEASRDGRDPGEPLQEVQCRPLSGEHWRGVPRQLGGDIARLTRLTVVLQAAERAAGIELAERLRGNVESRDDAVALRDDDAARSEIRWHGGLRRDVSPSEIFGNR